VFGVRAWTDETNGARGEKKKSSAVGRRLRFNRKRRGGGPGGVDAAWRKRARAEGVPVDRRAVPDWQRPEIGGRARRAPCTRCRATVPLTSGARRVVGEGERGGALTGGTGLSMGVDGGEAAACAMRA
jgi:hypothetical protein